ncbi:MAG: hypothetical protein AAFX06_17090 [Planctomycetota bacterium]
MQARESLQRVTEILVSERSASELWPEIQQLAKLLTDANESPMRKACQTDIGDGESWTSNGLAVSPTMASMCLDDFMRTIQFLRGVHDAIAAVRERVTGRPVRVLYAGCGPHATLVLPLMTLYPKTAAVFTLVDIHEQSLKSAEATVERFGVSDSVAEYRLQDASTLQIQDDPPDTVVLEVMQVCLQKEPQVAVTRHLMSQAPDAVLVPQEVRVRFELVDHAREFELPGEEPQERDRLPLGTVFSLDRNVIDLVEADGCLPAATITLPETWDSRYQVMLMTEIQTYGGHRLGDHESGLTCPQVYSGEAPPGRQIRFSYRLGDKPQLVGSVL